MRHWHKVIYTKAEIDHGQYVYHRNSGAVAFIGAELKRMIDLIDVKTYVDVDFMPSGDLLIHVLACYINRAMSGHCHLVGDTSDDIGRARWGLNTILERLGLAVEIKNEWVGSIPQLGQSAYKKSVFKFVKNRLTKRWLNLVEDKANRIEL